MQLNQKLDRILEDCVGTEGGCLLYQGRLQNGYVLIYHESRLKGVHLHMWEKLNGVIPPGKRLRNKCGNRNCLSMSHWKRADVPAPTKVQVRASSVGSNAISSFRAPRPANLVNPWQEIEGQPGKYKFVQY